MRKLEMKMIMFLSDITYVDIHYYFLSFQNKKRRIIQTHTNYSLVS